MPRKAYETMVDEVKNAITAAGGEITHAALVEQLDDATANNIKQMVGNGVIVRRLVAQPDAPARLSYTLPAPTAPQV